MLKNIFEGSAGPVVEGVAEEEFDAACDEGVADVAGVGDGECEPVELGHDEGVAGAEGGQGPPQAGSGAASSRTTSSGEPRTYSGT
jgi:hypothetical protein